MKFRQFLHSHRFLLIAILISVFAGSKLLTSAHFHTHDDLQVFRLNEYLSCLADRQLPCRWSANLGKGYGYPYFIFYPPMIYAIPAFIHLAFNLSLIASLNLFAFLTFPLASIGMYFLIRALTNSKLSAFTASTLYTLAPYHALNVFVRGVYAENLAWAIFPYLLYFIYKLFTSKPSKLNFLFLTLSMAGLWLTHNISSMLMLPLLLIWSFVLAVTTHNWKKLFNFSLSLLLSLGMSAFFILPAILEKSLVQTDSMIYGYYSYLNHFVSLKQIFISNYWGYGGSNFGTQYDEMSFAIGYALSLGSLFLVIYNLLKSKLSASQRLLSLGFTFIGFFTLFMMHNQSTPIWNLLTPLTYIQFPWRLLGIATIFLVISIGYNLQFLTSKLRLTISIVLVALTFFTSYHHFQPEHYDTYQDQDFISGQFKGEQQTAHIYDYLPITAHSVPDELATQPIFKSTQSVSVDNFTQTSHSLTLNYQTNIAQLIILATYFYPGWEAKLDSQAIKLQPDPQYGFISFNSPVGNHQLSLTFIRTPLRKLADTISLASLVVLGLILMYNKSHEK